jgi:PAS domain S-box-containing protein
VLLINVFPMVGYIYGIRTFYILPPVGIAWPTVVALTSLATGLLLACIEDGPMALLLRRDAGGFLLRRLLPLMLLVPLVLGFLRVQGERLGLYPTEIGSSLLVITLTLLFAVALWRSAVRLSRSAGEEAAAQQALRESEHRFSLLAAATFEGVAITEGGRIVEANEQLARLLGYELQEIIGRDVASFILPEDRDRVLTNIREEKESWVEHRVLRKDGSVLVVGTHGRTATYQGRTVRFTAILDITEQKRAEEALRESEERLRLLGDNLPDSAVYQYVQEIDGRVRFLYFSAGMERLNGVSVQEVLRDAGELHRQIPPEYLARLLEAEAQSARDLTDFDMEVPIRRRDEQVRWMQLHSRPRQMPDGRVVWDGVQTDVTERKRAQEALLRSEKLASVGRMAATIAHEINNPLEALTNILFIAKGIKDLPESARQYLETADAELKCIAHITRQSLGFYRESNAPVLMSVNAVLESAADLLKNKIKAKHAVIEKQWDRNVEVTAVAGELRQVFSNLLANSLDAIEEKGTIKLRVSTCAAFHKGIRCVRVTIADNGRGIDASSRQHIFEPFFTTKGTVGTGLGLWVSKQIVDKHGGRIQMRSSTEGVRRGTAFSVVLPLVPEAETATSESAEV